MSCTGGVDPMGLDTVAIYHGDDKGNEDDLAGGGEFEQAADDYDHAIDADSPDHAAQQMQALRDSGVVIDEIHIFDHGVPGEQELGDENLFVGESWRKIVKDCEEVFLHGCNVGETLMGSIYIQLLADDAGCNVTAWTGVTHIDTPHSFRALFSKEDFFNDGEAVTAKPGGDAKGDYIKRKNAQPNATTQQGVKKKKEKKNGEDE